MKEHYTEEEMMRKIDTKTSDWEDVLFHGTVYQKLSEDFMRKYKDKICWFFVSKWQKLSESFMDEMWDYLDKRNLAEYQTMSEDFIRKHMEDFERKDWMWICMSQKLSESFVREMRDEIMWVALSLKDKSEDFEREFQKELRLGN